LEAKLREVEAKSVAESNRDWRQLELNAEIARLKCELDRKNKIPEPNCGERDAGGNDSLPRPEEGDYQLRLLLKIRKVLKEYSSKHPLDLKIQY